MNEATNPHAWALSPDGDFATVCGECGGRFTKVGGVSCPGDPDAPSATRAFPVVSAARRPRFRAAAWVLAGTAAAVLAAVELFLSGRT